MVTPLLASAPQPVAPARPLPAPDVPDLPALRPFRVAPAGLNARHDARPVETAVASQAW
jgi:hypothetical protein